MPNFQQTRTALGSKVELTVVTTDADARLEPLFAQLWSRIAEFEGRFSRFLDQSELSMVNRRAGEWMDVTPEFMALFVATKQAAEQSGGLFNPLVLPALQRAGYITSWVDATVSGPDFTDRTVLSPDNLEVRGSKVRLPSGSALDFGGSGKGYLLDQLADYLDEQGWPHYSLSLGGDVLVRGANGVGVPWEVSIASADDDAGTLATAISSGDKRLAVATSGITKRRGVHNARRWHHLIDPRSGQPAVTDLLTATVCATSGLEADVLATSAVILGLAAAPDYLDKHHVGVLFCSQNRPKPLY